MYRPNSFPVIIALEAEVARISQRIGFADWRHLSQAEQREACTHAVEIVFLVWLGVPQF